MGTAKFLAAYTAFHGKLPELLDEGHVGKWVLYWGDELIEMSADRDRLYEVVRDRGWPDSDILIECILPEPEAIDENSLYNR